mgnify:CR=1 FL=1
MYTINIPTVIYIDTKLANTEFWLVAKTKCNVPDIEKLPNFLPSSVLLENSPFCPHYINHSYYFVMFSKIKDTSIKLP